MKLSDLFEDYSIVEGIQIVRVLNLNTYFAVMSAEGGETKLTMVRYLDKSIMKKIKDNELTVDELLGEIWQWHPIQDFEAHYSLSEITDIIESAKEKDVAKNKLY